MGRGSTVGYVDVSVWGKAGEACEAHLRQGWLVGVSGRLEYREWQADDGSRRSERPWARQLERRGRDSNPR